jgi:3-phosphoshikimate 1-carboxyvinyltransferase
MKTLTLHAARKFSGRLQVPGDKSISHRSLIFGALAHGRTRVTGLLRSDDVLSTWRCLERLGVTIRDHGDEVEVEGVGLHGLRASSEILDCGNSGTTIRLLMGVLSAQRFDSEMTGDGSLRNRPMKRVADPLRKMGAQIELTEGGFAPLKIRASAGGRLDALAYELPVASAQVKSALLLAGIFANGKTVLSGKIQSRDHTERMLPHFGVPLHRSRDRIELEGGTTLHAASVRVPGDFSTAAFWLAAGAMIPGAQIQLDSVSLNPTRLGFLKVLQRMGARIETKILEESPEPIGTVSVWGSPLRAVRVEGDEIPELIDELPMLAVLATQAEGVTEVRGAGELRVKESDRIETTGRALRAMGAEVALFEDGFSVRGRQKLHGGKIKTLGDHRIAMAFSIAAMVAEGETEIVDPDCVSVSCPGFYGTLEELTRG